MSRKRQSQKRKAAERALGREVHAAAGDMGWLVPLTEDQVRRAEDELAAAEAQLPDELTDPQDLFDRPPPGEPTVLPMPRDADIDATLGRAAREAGHISPEIEQLMRRDRAAAEREMDDEDKAT